MIAACSGGSGGSTSATVATVGRMPEAVQRVASNGLLDVPETSSIQAASLARFVERVRSGVHLVRPAGNGSYTLTSSSAPLPVTVTNDLDTDVRVRISVTAEDNRPGFEAQSVTVTLPANTTQQERVPTRIQLTGRINVVVSLTTMGADALPLFSLDEQGRGSDRAERPGRRAAGEPAG